MISFFENGLSLNHQRLHVGIRYLRPVDYHFGDPDKLVNIRKNKLDKARVNRKLENQRKLNEENRSRLKQSKSPICA